MPITLKQASEYLPVSVEMVKIHTVLSSDNIEDELLIRSYINAAAAYGQNITGRVFVQSTFECDLDEFPIGEINLLPNLQSVASVKYTDEDGEDVTLDASEYDVKKTGLVGYIRPVTSWPAYAEDIVIEFDAGWPVAGDTFKAPTLPEDIKAWIMIKVAGMYLQRESFVLSSSGKLGIAQMPKDFIDHALDCYIVPGLGAGI